MQLWDIFSLIRNSRQQYNGQDGPEAACKYYEDNKEQMDKGSKVLWPERWSLYDLMSMYDDEEMSFMREMQNSPRDISDFSFDLNNINFWTDRFTNVDELLEVIGKTLTFYGACDPSMGKSMIKGSFSAIIVLGRDNEGNMYILFADIERRNTTKLVRDILAYHERFNFMKFGFETNGAQDLFIKDIEREGKKKGLLVPLESINNNGDKTERIHTLYNWIKNGTLRFCKHHKALMDECRDFPFLKNMDGLDALQMATRVASKHAHVSFEEKMKLMDSIYRAGKTDFGKMIWSGGQRQGWKRIDNSHGLFGV
jgi:predicted phage terminase large subunit-like protein